LRSSVKVVEFVRSGRLRRGEGGADDLEEVVGGEAEVGGGGDKLAGCLLCAGQTVFAGGADEGAGAAAGLDEAGFLELAVGAGDGVDGEAEVGGELADGGQAGADRQPAVGDLAGELGLDLLVRRNG